MIYLKLAALLLLSFVIFAQDTTATTSIARMPRIDDCRFIFCNRGQICLNGKCVRNTTTGPNCMTIRCSAGFTCVNGTGCVKNPPTGPNCSTIRCSSGYTCIDGRGCVRDNNDNCAAVSCLVGYDCQNGRCIKRKSQCDSRSICSGGYCLPSTCKPCPRGAQCLVGPTCPGGFKCVNNKCSLDCDFPVCAPGMMCILGGKCQDIQDGIQKCDS